MQRSAAWSAGVVALFLAILLGSSLVGGQPGYAAEPTAVIKLQDAVAPAPSQVVPEWLGSPPTLTEAREAYLESQRQQMHLSPRIEAHQPQPQVQATEPPDPKTASQVVRPRTMAPLAPDSASLYRYTNFGGAIPASRKSFVMSPSVAAAGKYVFYTGNWFVAKSTDGGATWRYMDPFADFPDFSGEQVTIYDAARNRLFWLRVGAKNFYGENVFKLGVSGNHGASFCMYTVSPKSVNAAWVNHCWDYPNIQLGSRYLYLTWNLFDKNNLSARKSAVLIFPLDALASCNGFSLAYFPSDWFTLVPVQGADHTMYWASNWPQGSGFFLCSYIGIFKYQEDMPTVQLSKFNIVTWQYTNPNVGLKATCGATAGNWTGSYDQRILTGARHYINYKNVKKPGRSVLSWWWNVMENNNYPKPFIYGVSFYENDLTRPGDLMKIPPTISYPHIWSRDICYAYPSAAVNQRGDLGMIVNFAVGPAFNPSVAYAILDEASTFPPWTFNNVAFGGARPPVRAYGLFNTVRPYYPPAYAWAAAAYFLGGTTAAQFNPIYFVFGRERDKPSWQRWLSY